MPVRRRNIHQGHIEREYFAPEKGRDLGEKNRDVIGTAGIYRMPDVRADEKCVYPEALREFRR